MDVTHILIAVSVGLVVISGWMLMRSRSQKNDLMAVLRQVEREQARSRPKAPASPIDLLRPIGEAEWKKLHGLRRDERYRQALATVRGRYSVVSDPMLLARTLRETMERRRVDLAEAIIMVADGHHDHRVG